MTFRRMLATILLTVCSAACSTGREFELSGQILAVNPERQEITVKHGDIRGFMPGMTMPFRVGDRKWLEGRAPGELIRATLVVRSNDVYLKDIERTGDAPLPPVSSLPRRFARPDGQLVPELTFLDQRGRSHVLSEFRGRALAVTFVYTRCPLPDFCPLMDRNLAAVQRSLDAEGPLRDKVHLLSVSVDPEFDRPDVLLQHARRAGANPETWSFVTGDRDEVERFASWFDVSIMREDTPAQEVVHNLRTAVIDPSGRVVKVFAGNDWQPSELLAALRAASARG
jgi:protein SCO1/2